MVVTGFFAQWALYTSGFRIVICSLENEAYEGQSLCNIDHEGGNLLDSFDIITAGSNSKLNKDHSLQTGKVQTFWTLVIFSIF